MGKKWVIELPENTHWVQWILESTKDHHPYMDFKQVEDLTPYTEPDIEQIKADAYNDGYKVGREAEKVRQKLRQPDIEQIRKEGYEKGLNDANYAIADDSYKKGLSDAWEAARKIAYMYSEKRKKIFGENLIQKIQDIYSASECIKKIRQYEQYEQEEQFQVGDEFEIESGKRFVILKMDGAEIDRYINEEGKTYCMVQKYKVMRKTGRHFPEIDEVLRKMKDGDNE